MLDVLGDIVPCVTMVQCFSNLDGFVYITWFPKKIDCCIHVCPWKTLNSDIFAHL